MIDAALQMLKQYALDVVDTDVLPSNDLRPILQGLYGEVGGIMSTAKKHVREGAAYPGFRRAAEEEFGDALWYLAALCRRLNLRLEDVFADAFGANGVALTFDFGAAWNSVVQPDAPLSMDAIDRKLVKLGQSTAALLEPAPERSRIYLFTRDYLEALQAVQISLSDVAQANVKKTRGAFLVPPNAQLPDFDAQFGIEEQLPRTFRIRVSQRKTGRSYLQWNGVFIGDPLTDNIADKDGYRFHDAFHFSYAAILHWSPVMRALLKHKRKSAGSFDENQDGGRAIVVEEGLTALIFSHAKELNYFEGQERVSLGLLKSIGDFVKGYEVDQCPLKLWERAILQGYDVFRKVLAAEGGWIVGDRGSRTIQYLPLESMQ